MNELVGITPQGKMNLGTNIDGKAGSSLFPDVKISIIIPCFNEQNSIGSIIQKVMALNFSDYEIIVVDDGSKDESINIIQSINGPISIIKHSKNKGYGMTLLDGILKARGNIIVTIDSDGQHDPSDIPKSIFTLIEKNADMVIGSRYLGIYHYNIPITNRIGESFLESVLFFLYGKRLRNNQAGFRVFRRNLAFLFKGNKFYDMAFTFEILMRSLNHGYRIMEVPIRLRGRAHGKSNVRKIKLLKDLFICIFYYTTSRLKNPKLF